LGWGGEHTIKNSWGKGATVEVEKKNLPEEKPKNNPNRAKKKIEGLEHQKNHHQGRIKN
jgi:hypothetical protein